MTSKQKQYIAIGLGAVVLLGIYVIIDEVSLSRFVERTRDECYFSQAIVAHNFFNAAESLGLKVGDPIPANMYSPENAPPWKSSCGGFIHVDVIGDIARCNIHGPIPQELQDHYLEAAFEYLKAQ